MYFRVALLLLMLINLANARVQGYNYGWEGKDNESVIDSTLPMPKEYKGQQQPTPHLEMPESQSIINKLDSITPLDINVKSPLQNELNRESKYDKTDSNNALVSKKSEPLEDIDYRIHELEKEKYMLESKLYFKEKEKKDWSSNILRSGYFVGGGVMLDFALSANANDGIKVVRLNKSGLIKAGFIRYNHNNLGLKIEVFNIFGLSNQSGFFDYMGGRISILNDVRIFGKNNHLGIIVGFGLGLGFIGDTRNIGLNLHLGMSVSITKHHRLEIERIVLNPLNPLAGKIDYLNNYIVSYSFIF